ncbi:MAG: hypothetical protein KIT31_41100 [Deltaproteobacteria bacterium]|nr:hypothetical protein [Deltaproteobacteria bacterium]
MRKRRQARRWAVVAIACAIAVGFVVAFALVFGGGDDGVRLPRAVGDCEPGPTTPGIDVSYHQDKINWKRVRADGKLFAFVRVSDGTTVPDPLFAKNWVGAKQAGLLRGAYQYFRPGESALAQADMLIKAVGTDRGELPPVIDVETDGGRSPAQIAERVRVWVARVRDRLGVEPIIYTGPEFWRERVGGADLTSQPLWIAHYTRPCPSVPEPWTRWTFWQHSDAGEVRGIDGPVDLDVFQGNYAELEEFARRSRLPRQASTLPPPRR